jgi:hypothetical protein
MSIENNSPQSQKIGRLNRIWMFIKNVWNRDWFEPHASFLTLKSFWVPFIVIVVVFVAMWIKVIVDEQLGVGLDASLYEMYDWFKVPLWWLALLIPVLGLLNANHKSEQTRAQMDLTRSQNNFANYYKHLEEFTKYVAEIRELHEKSNYEIEIYHRKLHNVFFPNARTMGVRFDLSIQRALFDSLYGISQLVPLLIGLEKEKFETVKLKAEGVRRLLDIVVAGCIEHKTVSFSKFPYNAGRKGTVNIMEGYSLRGAFQQCLWESTVLLELASFDENFDKYSYYIQLINLLKKQVERSPDKISKHYGIETEGATRRPENSVLHSIGITIEKIQSEYLKN